VRVLVYPHDLNIGGSQLNAIEIAAELQRMGHSCVVFGRPGPLVGRISELGLEFVESPDPRRRPSPAVMRTLARVVEERTIDVIHGYEWPPAIESWLVASGQCRDIAAVGTVMSMAVAPFLPRTMPLVVGTHQIAAAERQRGRRLTAVVEPPVDLHLNAPAVCTDVHAFRSRYGIDNSALNVVSVTRLARELKLEGLLVAIDTLPALNAPRPLRVIIVGDGPARELVSAHAEEVNRRIGRTAVILTGELADPRPAYDAADILLGMGGSALRSLAFAKPLVVQGERGFWRLLTEQSVDDFLWTGWYGVGRGSDRGAATLAEEIEPVLHDMDLRDDLGRFGRNLVEQRFGLTTAARRQLRIYQAARELAPGPARLSMDGGRSCARYARYVVSRRAARLRGRRSVDDFNSNPVVASGPRRPDRQDDHG
jgi:glycosyltransferase involved in cell wall biosynthesis